MAGGSRWPGHGSEFAQGWIGLGGSFNELAELLVTWVEVLARHVTGSGRGHVEAALSQGDEVRTLPPLRPGGGLIDVDSLWLLDALAQGALLRLQDPPPGRGQVALVHRPDGDSRAAGEAVRLTPIELYWLVPRPPAVTLREVGRDLDRILRLGCALDTCVGAATVATGVFDGSLPAAFPMERLNGTAKVANRLDWVRTHVRTAGWRTLVPLEALTKSPRPRCPVIKTAAGLLVAAGEPDPFSVAESTVAEIANCVAPYLGTALEAETFLGRAR